MKQEHPMWEDELMAFADGQLEASHAERIGLHLEECSECALAVAESRQVSEQLSVWKIEEAPERLTKSVLGSLKPLPNRRNFGLPAWWTRTPILGYCLLGAVPITLSVVIMVLWDYPQRQPAVALRSPSAAIERTSRSRAAPETVSESGSFDAMTMASTEELSELQHQLLGAQRQLRVTEKEAPTGAMVIRSIQLTLIARNFEAARAGIESIVRDSKGYIDRMTVQTNPGTAMSLSAVVRIPADRLDSSLVSLRQLGHPREESQNSTDISGQYVDLVARLNNSRNTEQRLLTLLRERTGNLKDIVAAEGELSRVREEIERMEAQRKSFDNKVQYASVKVEVSEEYHAELQPRVPATGTRFQNAAVEGLDSAAEAVMGIALAGLSYGPSALVWLTVVALLALTARRLYLSLVARRSPRSEGSR